MIFAAILLTIVGLLTSVLGLKLFRLILPLVGLVSGFMVGFGGFQGVFGKGVISSTVAILVALMIGLIFAVLAFALLDVAVKVFAIVVGASAFAYLGIVIGLDKNGFLVFMLSVAGAILSAIAINAQVMSLRLVVTVTSLIGVAYMLFGFMLVVGKVSLADLNDAGVIPTLLRVVDQSFLWLFIWLGGSVVAMQLQYRLAVIEFINDSFAYEVQAPRKAK